MNRRDFLKLSAAGAAALSLPNMVFSAASARNKPNVLFMAIDDLNDWVGCLGGHPDSHPGSQPSRSNHLSP
jgi:anaerobic selenocysteine-containing dehydrogenase